MLLDHMLVEPRFGPAFRLLAASIARHVETGEKITQHTDLSAELARVHEHTTVPTSSDCGRGPAGDPPVGVPALLATTSGVVAERYLLATMSGTD